MKGAAYRDIHKPTHLAILYHPFQLIGHVQLVSLRTLMTELESPRLGGEDSSFSIRLCAFALKEVR